MFIFVFFLSSTARDPIDLSISGVAPDLTIHLNVACKIDPLKISTDFGHYGTTSQMLLPVQLIKFDEEHLATIDPFEYCSSYNPDYLPDSLLIHIFSHRWRQHKLLITIPSKIFRQARLITVTCNELTHDDFTVAALSHGEHRRCTIATN
jgi:hypothetical protein